MFSAVSSGNYESRLERIAASDSALAETIRRRHGFIGSAEIDRLIAIDRLMPVLVRCGGGRFTCPVQDVRHFMEIIRVAAENSSHWSETDEYVRDVSIPA